MTATGPIYPEKHPEYSEGAWTDINDNGVAVGYGGLSFFASYMIPAIYKNGVATYLPRDGDLMYMGINNSEQILGIQPDVTGFDANYDIYLVENGVKKKLSSDRRMSHFGVAINNHGDVIYNEKSTRGNAYWNHNGIERKLLIPNDFGILDYRDESYASDINDNGWIVGGVQRNIPGGINNQVAFLAIDGQMHDLQTLSENYSDATKYTFSRVGGLNNRGQIVCRMYEKATQKYNFIRLDPVPEPATMTALAFGTLALMRRRKVRRD